MDEAERVLYFYSNVCEECCRCRSYRLSPAELTKLNDIRRDVRVKFSQEDPKHMDLLRNMWRILWPEEVPPEDLVAKNWMTFGFQSTKPSTDFRAAGVFGLQQILYLATVYPQEFEQIQETARDYPFAISAINVTYQLMYMFQLGERHSTPLPGTRRARVRTMKVFSGLITANHEVLNELYVVAVIKMHFRWLEMKKQEGFGIMRFNECVAYAIDFIIEVLNRNPLNMEELKAIAFS